MKRYKFPKTPYVLDLKSGTLYKRVKGVNPRWKSHRNSNRITEFYAKVDPYGEIIDNKNITPKAIANPRKYNQFKQFKNEDLALLAEARFYVANKPNDRYNKLFRERADEIIERVGKDNPELVIWKNST